MTDKVQERFNRVRFVIQDVTKNLSNVEWMEFMGELEGYVADQLNAMKGEVDDG